MSCQHSIGHEVEQSLVKISAAKFDIAVGSQGPKRWTVDLQNGHVKGAPAQIVDQDFFRPFACSIRFAQCFDNIRMQPPPLLAH